MSTRSNDYVKPSHVRSLKKEPMFSLLVSPRFWPLGKRFYMESVKCLNLPKDFLA